MREWGINMQIKYFDIVLFEDFDMLDVFGPAEVISNLPDLYNIRFISQSGGIIQTNSCTRIDTIPFTKAENPYAVLIPGGRGTRTLVHDKEFINQLEMILKKPQFILTVCTGSALLAKTSLLDNKKASTNKNAYEWVCSQNSNVHWQRHARWSVDGNIYSSAGVSAGIDMILGFISDIHNQELAVNIAQHIEYVWTRNKDSDL